MSIAITPGYQLVFARKPFLRMKIGVTFPEFLAAREWIEGLIRKSNSFAETKQQFYKIPIHKCAIVNAFFGRFPHVTSKIMDELDYNFAE